jgi:tRNA A-37 threonylcarbamoyl transferase component Bud32/class 3 adenylate cyclase
MEIVASVLYARLRNVAAICKALTPERSAEFVSEVRTMLERAISRESGIIAMARPDSVLAIFFNDGDVRPDHARRALHAALVCVYDAMELSKQIVMRDGGAALPPLTLTVGVHLGKVDVDVNSHGGASGLIRASGEAPEIARALESAASDLRWSIVASGVTRLAAGERIEAGRVGSFRLPDGVFLEVNEITGLTPTRTSRTPREVYDALRDAIKLNEELFDRPQDLFAAAGSSVHAATSQFTIEGYRVLRKIGQGGMSDIYLVSAVGADALQVLKVMRMAGANQGDGLQRFLQEFALLAQVQHPNVAQIYRQDFSHGHAYIAMEYFSHGDLRARIASGVSTAEAIDYIKQAAAALGAIHKAGIVHRDLKPDNLMLRADGTLALTDFGIAKHVSILITETAHDQVVGTPYYLSPEQALAQPIDHRCDLYSLGILFYELLTGGKPYRASTAEDLLRLHVKAPVPLLSEPHEALQPLLEMLMAKDRDQRYPTAQAFLDDLAARGF